MKKKIGFIDLFLDEWHANNYPAWFAGTPRANEFELAYAWEERSKPDGLAKDAWCQKFGVKPAGSIEEIVDKCDAILVLAPSNPEVHERLADLPLKSGKPVYIDKPFAPDRATAERIVSLAKQYHTPLMSSSALRFGEEVTAARAAFGDEKITFAATDGCGSTFEEYGIHQLEMLVLALGTGAKKIMRTGSANDPALSFLVAYDDDRHGQLTYHPNLNFRLTMASKTQIHLALEQSNMFQILLASVLDFYATGVSPIDINETLEIAALLGTMVRAKAAPGQWCEVC